MPELSVCIPTFNCAHYLPQAIASVMRQGLHDFEIVIIDNASDDDTGSVVAELRNPHIRYLRNPTNIGSRENGNRCLAEARGTYIKILCADDVLLDDVLPEQLDILRRRSDVALVSCDMVVTDEHLRPQSIQRFFPGTCSGHRLKAACLGGMDNYIGGPSNVMFRSVDAIGVRSDPAYRFISDLKFCLQILQNGNYFNIGRPGYLYRRHSGSDTATNCPPGSHLCEFLRLIDEYQERNPLNCIRARGLGGALTPDMWRNAFLPRHVLQAFLTIPDLVRMRQYARSKSLRPEMFVIRLEY